MIKVLEHGDAHIVIRCPVCGCRFEFDETDIRDFSIVCPECAIEIHRDILEAYLND